MLAWLGRSRKIEQGWVALSLRPGALDIAQSRSGAGAAATVSCAFRPLEGGAASAEKAARDFQLGRFKCMTLLDPGEYQLLLVEAPAVPVEELKSALRWRIKDMLDYHVDDATIDVLDVPPEEPASGRNHWMFAVAARNDVIQARIREFEDARVPLQVIDIPETAQRNIAALYEAPGRGIALLHLGPDRGLLTINFKGELYLSRRLDVGTDLLLGSEVEAREAAFSRVLVELQRTFDHFERQFRFVSVTQLLIGPESRSSGLLEYLAANLGMPVTRVDLTQKLVFAAGEAPDSAEQSRMFHLIGASLRQETKAL